jgi:hypothetical protein
MSNRVAEAVEAMSKGSFRESFFATTQANAIKRADAYKQQEAKLVPSNAQLNRPYVYVD